MLTIILILVSLILLALAALNVSSDKVTLGWLGVLFFVLAWSIPLFGGIK